MTAQFTPAADAARLSAQCVAAYAASASLLETITLDLSEETRQALNEFISSGGRVGLELTTDQFAKCRTSVVAYEADGTRHMVASVAHVGRPVAH